MTECPLNPSFWRSHRPFCDTEIMLVRFFTNSASTFWNFSSIAADSGLINVIETIPSRMVIVNAGRMNCQAEIPAARATTASLARARRQKVSIAAKRVMNGNVVCARNGSFSALM